MMASLGPKKSKYLIQAITGLAASLSAITQATEMELTADPVMIEMSDPGCDWHILDSVCKKMHLPSMSSGVIFIVRKCSATGLHLGSSMKCAVQQDRPWAVL